MPSVARHKAERISTDSSNWTASDLMIQIDVRLFEGAVCVVTDTTGHMASRMQQMIRSRRSQ